MENQQDINRKFDDIVQPKIVQQVIKERRPPAKFPELRYLWGITLLGSFALMMLASIVQVFIGEQSTHADNTRLKVSLIGNGNHSVAISRVVLVFPYIVQGHKQLSRSLISVVEVVSHGVRKRIILRLRMRRQLQPMLHIGHIFRIPPQALELLPSFLFFLLHRTTASLGAVFVQQDNHAISDNHSA